MSSILATPAPTPIPFSMTPSPQPSTQKDNKIDDKVKQTLFDIKKYKWVLVAIAVLLVVLLLVWFFWGRKNDNTNAVRIGGGKASKKFASGCSA
jgi:disulfide bond formation protein DsbB